MRMDLFINDMVFQALKKVALAVIIPPFENVWISPVELTQQVCAETFSLYAHLLSIVVYTNEAVVSEHLIFSSVYRVEI